MIRLRTRTPGVRAGGELIHQLPDDQVAQQCQADDEQRPTPDRVFLVPDRHEVVEQHRTAEGEGVPQDLFDEVKPIVRHARVLCQPWAPAGR